jgi:hypothetical protein
MSINDFLEGKQKLRVLILGAYRPEMAERRLERLRECLISKGFKSTRLAKDFSDVKKDSQDLDEHFTLKSRKLVEDWADVPVFVFFKKASFLRRADNQGVASEITYTCLKVDKKQSCCAAFFEGKLEDFSSQVKGSVKIVKISYETFRNDNDLCEMVAGHCLKTLDRLFYYLS